MEYRLIRADGTSVWVRDETVAVRDAEYRPIMLQGCLRRRDRPARPSAGRALTLRGGVSVSRR